MSYRAFLKLLLMSFAKMVKMNEHMGLNDLTFSRLLIICTYFLIYSEHLNKFPSEYLILSESVGNQFQVLVYIYMCRCLLLFPRVVRKLNIVVVRSITLGRIVPIQGRANVFSSGTASRHKEL
jgi:hypothetical protein